jgi:hypothetical protein
MMQISLPDRPSSWMGEGLCIREIMPHQIKKKGVVYEDL